MKYVLDKAQIEGSGENRIIAIEDFMIYPKAL